MSDFFYDGALEDFSNGDLDWIAHTFKVVLLKVGYVANKATDEYLDDISATYRIATSGALTSKTAVGGVLDAANVTLSSVAGGSTITQLVIYRDTGAEGTSRLVAHIDGYAGLPYITDGGDVTIVWPDDANKIGKI